MSILKKIYYSCLLMIFAANTTAQNVETAISKAPNLATSRIDSFAKLAVRKIIIVGNRKTKEYLILREIQFKAGDSIIIGTLNEAFQQARQQVYNTTLFHEVNITLAMISAFEMDVIVAVRERWYIFPIPVFQVADRSFSEWLLENNGDLSRVNYGIRFTHNNFSGRRDPLKLTIISGYTQNISFSYAQPYSNKTLTQGFGVGGGFSQNREIAYKTSTDNKILFYQNDAFVRKEIYATASLRLQKGITYRHQFNLAYSLLDVSDSVISPTYNPNYFNDTTTTTKGLFDLSYLYQHTNVNNSAYPLKGVKSYLTFSKRGFGFNGTTDYLFVESGYSKYWAHRRNWYSSLQLIGHITLPFKQPYINQKAIGYGEANLRGLEYYVVDGVAFGILKSTIKKKLVSFVIPVPFSSSLIPNIPISIFAKTFADFGFSYNKKEIYTYLNNKLLYTGGFGIDILTLYDINLKIEYSFNQLGNSLLFFTTK